MQLTRTIIYLYNAKTAQDTRNLAPFEKAT